MNKYQKQKARRMKKLAKLGISHTCQKHVLKEYSFEQIDEMIRQVDLLKNRGILNRLQSIAANACKAIIELVKKGV